MLKIIEVITQRETEMISLNAEIEKAVRESGIKNGIMTIFSPHTTAAITINENADPDVKIDMLYALGLLSPRRAEYQHLEGNSHAHVKASLTGASEQVIIQDGRLVLGTWQDIFFCEFDGPRKRKVMMKIQSD